MSVSQEIVSWVILCGLLLGSFLIPRCKSAKYALDMATSFPGMSKRPNLALNKPSRISSVFLSKAAYLANDGKTNGHQGRDCAHTALYQYTDNWWTVDLGTITWVVAIEIWNRADCCTYRLIHFDVVVTIAAPPPAVINHATLCYHHGNTTIPGNFGFFRKCRIPIAGRHVTISKKVPSTEHLTLCEVRVFGLNVTECKAVDCSNLTMEIHVRSLLWCSVWCLEFALPCLEYDYSKATRLCQFEVPNDGQIATSSEFEFAEYGWTRSENLDR